MYREGIYRFFSFSYVDVKCALIGFDQATAYIEESAVRARARALFFTYYRLRER